MNGSDAALKLVSPSSLAVINECDASSDRSLLSSSDGSLNSTLHEQPNQQTTTTAPLQVHPPPTAQPAAAEPTNHYYHAATRSPSPHHSARSSRCSHTADIASVAIAPVLIAGAPSTHGTTLTPRSLFKTPALAAVTSTTLERLPAPGGLISTARSVTIAGTSKHSTLSSANSPERINKFSRHSSLNFSPSDANISLIPPSGSLESERKMQAENTSGQPEWFSAFLREYRQDRDNACDKLDHFESEFKNLNSRMAVLDAHVLALNQRLNKRGEEISELRQKLNEVSDKHKEISKISATTTVPPSFHNVDTFEVKVTGIPNEVADVRDSEAVVVALFNVLKLTSLAYLVSLLRP